MGTEEDGGVDDDAHSNAEDEDDVRIPLTSLTLNRSTYRTIEVNRTGIIRLKASIRAWRQFTNYHLYHDFGGGLLERMNEAEITIVNTAIGKNYDLQGIAMRGHTPVCHLG